MFYKEALKKSAGTKEFDSLAPVEEAEIAIGNGVFLKQFPYYYHDAFGENFVNIYALEIPLSKKLAFGMEFSRTGDYCIELTKKADKKVSGKLIGALNCNFGLIVDEFDRYPTDLSYNLHLEGENLVQLPVVDKPAILINKRLQVEMLFLHAEGNLKIGDLKMEWVGSQSKRYNYFYARERCVIYNSYNRGLLLVKDEITGTKKFFDPSYSSTRKDRKKIDVVVAEHGDSFVVTDINKDNNTHFFEGNFVISLPIRFTDKINIGDLVEIITIDLLSPKDYLFGSTGSPLFVPDVKESRKLILSDRNVQTRSLENRSAYKKNSKFCRSCIVKTKNKTIFFLADARKGKEGQEGLSIYMLRYTLAKLYPNFETAMNVDGGNAPKLVIKENMDYNVLGNLHYKNWPTKEKPDFSWNGYLGRKVPAMIYVYER